MDKIFLEKPENDIQLYLYEEILKKNNIPYELRKNGKSFPDILVEPDHIIRAKEVTAVIIKEKDNLRDSKKNDNRKKRMLAFFIFVIFIVIPLVYLIINTIK